MSFRWMVWFLTCLPHLLAGGEIALSFDDAPKSGSAHMTGPERSAMLLAKLEKLDIEEVVFYCNTNKLANHDGAARLKRYAAAGHRLGNHTHSHRRIQDMGVDAYIEDIAVADNLLKKMKGFAPWFRYPFLDQGRDHETRDRIWSSLGEMGYGHGYVTVDNYDWYLDSLFGRAVSAGKSVDMEKLGEAYVELLWEGILFYDGIAREVLGRSPKHVLLLHENDLAALFIDRLVTHFRANGWRIIPPSEAYRDPIAKQRPRVLLGQGRVAGLARESGFKGRLSHVSEDVAWLDAFVKKRGILEPPSP